MMKLDQVSIYWNEEQCVVEVYIQMNTSVTEYTKYETRHFTTSPNAKRPRNGIISISTPQRLLQLWQRLCLTLDMTEELLSYPLLREGH